MVTWPNLNPVLGDLPWAIAGAVATRRYMPERRTEDLDVLVLSSDAGTVRERMHAAGYSPTGELAIGGSSWRSTEGVAVDLIECDDAWCAEALSEAMPDPDADGQPVLTLAYLTLMKLLASRAQDVADVTRMLGLASDDELAHVRKVVAKHAPEIGDDLESMISLGKLETGQ